MSVDGSKERSDIEKLTIKAKSAMSQIQLFVLKYSVRFFKKVESCFVLYIYAGY